MKLEIGQKIQTENIGESLVLGQLTKDRYLLYNYEPKNFAIVLNLKKNPNKEVYNWESQLYMENILQVFEHMKELDGLKVLFKSRIF